VRGECDHPPPQRLLGVCRTSANRQTPLISLVVLSLLLSYLRDGAHHRTLPI
jgi:hypothetical protein